MTKNERYLLRLRADSPDQLRTTFSSLPRDAVTGIVLSQKKLKECAEELFPSAHVFLWQGQPPTPNSHTATAADMACIERFWATPDYALTALHIADRTFAPEPTGVIQAHSKVACTLLAASDFISTTAPKTCFFMRRPHNLFDFCLYSLLRLSRIPCSIINRGFFPNSTCVLNNTLSYPWRHGSLSTERPTSNKKIQNKTNSRSDPPHHPELQRIASSNAPEYMLNKGLRLANGRYHKPFFSFLRDLFYGLLHAPSETYRTVALHSFYEKHTSTSFLTSRSNYIFLPLHYQPEQTTAPGAYRSFWSQYYVALIIAKTLPPEWKLVVKEHPGTFYIPGRSQLAKKKEATIASYRSKLFYSMLINLPNTQLAPSSYSASEIASHATVVATVTGTIALEALYHNTPAVNFGRSPYAGIKGCAEVQKESDLSPTFWLEAAANQPSTDDVELFARTADSMCVHIEQQSAKSTNSRQLSVLSSLLRASTY